MSEGGGCRVCCVSSQPVVHEYYDEVVFTDPSPEFYKLLHDLAETKAPRHTLQARERRTRRRGCEGCGGDWAGADAR